VSARKCRPYIYHWECLVHCISSQWLASPPIEWHTRGAHMRIRPICTCKFLCVRVGAADYRNAKERETRMCPSVVDAASRRPLLRSLSLYAPVRGQPPRFSLTSGKDPRAVEREGTNGAEGGMYIAFYRCLCGRRDCRR
jgi:hypothetical protein